MPRLLLALLASSALVIGSFFWQGHYGFGIGDEGFLWYGVQRVQAGEVPILDFMSYDPGRYYWSAALTKLLHDDGIVTLQIAIAAFQLLGLFVALLLISQRRSRLDPALVVLTAITLFAWMFPRYKLFDISLSIFLIGVLTLLVQQPSRSRFFFAGLGVGIAAVFGINHGTYGLAGICGAAIYLTCRQRNVENLMSGLVSCGCGIVVGYLPILVLAAVVPGFATAYVNGIRSLLERGTNLPLPVPVPWLVPFTQLPLATAVTDALAGVFFICVIGFAVLGFLWVLRQALRQSPAPPELVACCVLALPYAHHVFSRADVDHLAQGIFPFLIGIFVVLKAWPRGARRIAALAIASASLVIALPFHPGWTCRVTGPCVTADVAGTKIEVTPETASILTLLNSVVGQYAPDGRAFVAAPLWPGAYALFKRKSPMWEIYALFPRGSEFELREIEQIKRARPGFALVINVALDGRDDLRFRSTHPLIERFIRDNFDPAAVADWPPRVVQLYRSR